MEFSGRGFHRIWFELQLVSEHFFTGLELFKILSTDDAGEVSK